MKLDWMVSWRREIAQLAGGASAKRRGVTSRRGRLAGLEALEERLLLTAVSDGTVASYVEIPTSAIPDPGGYGDLFGGSVTPIGDLNGDGVTDLAVGAPTDRSVNGSVGAVHILFLNADGTVASTTTIASGIGGGPVLGREGLSFGAAVTALGDLNGDGIVDLAVGADDGTVGKFNAGLNSGAVYILFLNTDGTVQSWNRIGKGTKNTPQIGYFTLFGRSLAAVGDLDGDGVTDLAVGAESRSAKGRPMGRVDILFMKTDGTIKSSVTIGSHKNGGPKHDVVDWFGAAVSAVGDVNGDGVIDLAVGAYADSIQGPRQGAAYILFMKANGKVKSSTKIASGVNGGPVVGNYELFGQAVAGIGDINGDGIPDLAVSDMGPSAVTQTPETGVERGTVHLLLLNSDGTVKSSIKIPSSQNGAPPLQDGTAFGLSIAAVGDLNGDGISELAVGTRADTLYILFLNSTEQIPTVGTN